ncbi:MAG TPA: glycoside hydrolase family 31 protein [bacterium]|nr:glycoside hydrolase family 31 protein [bacterium]
MAKKRKGYTFTGKVEKVTRISNGADVRLENGFAAVEFYSPEIVRVQIDKEKAGEEQSWAVIKEKPESIDFSLEKGKTGWTLSSDAVTVVLNKDPFRLEFRVSGEEFAKDIRFGAAGWKDEKIICEKACGTEEHFYGFGEKAFNMDRRKTKMVNWNKDNPFYTLGSDPLYVTIPFFIGLNGGKAYGLFFDTPWKSFFNMCSTSKKTYSFGAEGGSMNYYFIAGPAVRDVVERYTELTGRMNMPPAWSLGHHQSRWSYKTEKKVRTIAKRFREKSIPCDVIHLDIHYMDGYRMFTWDDKRFPDPAGMISSLKEDGFRIITIHDPGVKIEKDYSLYEEGIDEDYFLRRSGGTLFRGIVWPGETHFPDFTRPEVREWWAGHVSDFMDKSGVAGIWNDMNEPSINIKPYKRIIRDHDVVHNTRGVKEPHLKYHNVYGHTEGMATNAGQLNSRPEERPFLLTRSGYAGIQRFSAVWSGDNYSRWGDMRLSIPLLCNLGLSGVSFVGPDIGGFGGNCNAELYARWIEMGVFYPFCRTHTMLMSRAQEPWSFGKKVTDIARDYIELRYRLMPYIYNAFRESEQTGIPVMRPLMLEFQEDPACAGINDEFMFGPALLVAPIMKSGQRSRKVYLPRGEWVDFFTGEKFAGGTTIEVRAPLEKLPLFVRQGYIIPMTVTMQYTDEKPRDPMILHVECGRNASLELYEDDGVSFDYKNGKYSITSYDYSETGKGLVFKSKVVETGFRPERGNVVASFRNVNGFPASVRVDGKEIHESWFEVNAVDGPLNGWCYDEKARVLRVGYPEEFKDTTIEVEF